MNKANTKLQSPADLRTPKANDPIAINARRLGKRLPHANPSNRNSVPPPQAGTPRTRSTCRSQLLHTAQIVNSKWSPRHHERLSDDHFRKLKALITKTGRNAVPILVRPTGRMLRIDDRELAEYELIYGRRRHWVCHELGISVLALIRSVDDHQLVVLMHAENAARKDLSAFERGKAYDLLIPNAASDAQGAKRDTAPFKSQRELAEALGVDAGDVSRCRYLAKLPAAVLAVLDSPSGLSIHDANRLRPAMQEHEAEVLRRAAEILETEGPLPARDAVRRLTDFTVKPAQLPDLVRSIDVGDRSCGELKVDAMQCASIVLTVPMTPKQIEGIEAAVRRVLQKVLNGHSR